MLSFGYYDQMDQDLSFIIMYNIHPFAYCYNSVNVNQFLSFPKVIPVSSFLCISDCKKPHSCFASVYFSITQILSIINDFWDFVAYNLYKEHFNKKCFDKIWFFLTNKMFGII